MSFYVPTADDEPRVSDGPECTVEVTEPEVLGYLLGPDGEPIATLLDRRVVPFGFTRSRT